jgi:hypothetical protein
LIIKTLRKFLSPITNFRDDYLFLKDIYRNILVRKNINFNFLLDDSFNKKDRFYYYKLIIFNFVISSYLNSFYFNRGNYFLDSSKTLSLCSLKHFTRNDFLYASDLVN